MHCLKNMDSLLNTLANIDKSINDLEWAVQRTFVFITVILTEGAKHTDSGSLTPIPYGKRQPSFSIAPSVVSLPL